tara:strand:- start:695 stop:1012 length:318 start_codon:yes stop_codon:yes gene_type:complete
MPVFMEITKSKVKGKKWTATFSHFVDGKKKKIKTVSFGSAGMADYTLSKDKDQRRRYIERHNPKTTKENWNDYMSAGALSRYLLWGAYTSLDKNISAYKRKFKLK